MVFIVFKTLQKFVRDLPGGGVVTFEKQRDVPDNNKRITISVTVRPHRIFNMKPNFNAENDAPLRKVLGEWVVENAALPPRFQEQVWQRIAREEAQVKPGVWQNLAQWVEATFSRPALAASYVAVLLFAGLSTGYWQAHGKSTQTESQQRAFYVQSVDPYQAPRN